MAGFHLSSLFLDRNKTLLPRVDVIYFLTRLMTAVGIVWFMSIGDFPAADRNLFYLILATFIVHLVVFFAAVKGKFDIKLAYLSAVIYDIILIPILIIYTGGLHSSYFLLFYLTVSVAAYVLTFGYATAVAVIVSLAYCGSIMSDLVWDNLFDVVMRVGFIWVYFLVLSYASRFLRRSEKRLMKLFDTLNMRTSELEKSQAELEMIYENTRTLASLLDADGVIREMMRIMGTLLQYQNCAFIFKDRRENYYYRARVLSGQASYQPKAITGFQLELVHKVFEFGEPITINDVSGRDDYLPLDDQTRSLMIVPLTSHGKISGCLVAESNEIGRFKSRDLQMLSVVARSAGLALENAELHKRTAELTVIDELTGIYNYRYFVNKLKEEKRRALRYELPLSLIMVDIDWFKKFNDTYGHEVGNAVLKKLAKIILLCIRDVDVFARYGGEEFVVILPQTPLEEATTIGERIRSQVEAEILEIESVGKLKITVSVGISSFPENGYSHEQLVSVADQALYRAKGEGRNLVRVI